jgi:biotin transport system substrate-specific component
MQSAVQAHPGLPHDSASYLESLQKSLTGKIVLAVVATGFVAACAHISVPLPFTPVPITLQNFAVILVGMILGPAAGFSAIVLYLAEGALGLPVFTPYSAGGIAHLLGPNGGYLFSYPLAAAIAGWVVRSMQRVTSRFRSAIVASTIATFPILLLPLASSVHCNGVSAPKPINRSLYLPYMLSPQNSLESHHMKHLRITE